MSPNQAIFSTFIIISYLLVFIKKYIPGSIVYFVLLYFFLKKKIRKNMELSCSHKLQILFLDKHGYNRNKKLLYYLLQQHFVLPSYALTLKRILVKYVSIKRHKFKLKYIYLDELFWYKVCLHARIRNIYVTKNRCYRHDSTFLKSFLPSQILFIYRCTQIVHASVQ